jgi:short-subunit dehydrogenase
MKKAIIVGATSGIGKELAKILAENHYKVGITGRRTALLTELKLSNPEAFWISTFDITDTETSTLCLENLVAELGGLDLLFISSGTGDFNDNLDFSIEKHTIDTNVLGFTCVAGWAFNFFEKQKHGHLAAISSVAGLRGNRSVPSYNATKAFQINYLEALRQKAKHLKIQLTVTDIRPGFVETAMAKGDGQFWVAPLEKAARQIFHALELKKKVVYITKRWWLVAKILKHIPPLIYDRL